MKKTIKELYVTGVMTVRTHNAIHKAMNSQHNFKLYDDVEWMTCEDLLINRNIKGSLREKIVAMATM